LSSQNIVDPKAKSLDKILSVSQKIKEKVFGLREGFMKWKAFSVQSKMAHNALKKILKINHKHITARYSASSLLLSHLVKKRSKELLSLSFKQLAYYSISQNNNLNKPAILNNSNKTNTTLIISAKNKDGKKDSGRVIGKEISNQTIMENTLKIGKNSHSPLQKHEAPLATNNHQSSIQKLLSRNENNININLGLTLESHPFNDEETILHDNKDFSGFESARKLTAQILGSSPVEGSDNALHTSDLSFYDESNSPRKNMLLERTKKPMTNNTFDSYSTLSFDRRSTNLFKENMENIPEVRKSGFNPNMRSYNPLQERLNSMKLDLQKPLPMPVRMDKLAYDSKYTENHLRKTLQTLDYLVSKELQSSKEVISKDADF